MKHSDWTSGMLPLAEVPVNASVQGKPLYLAFGVVTQKRGLSDVVWICSLAYLELRCVLAYFLSRFEMALTGNCGDRLRWVDRFVAVNLDDVEIKLLRDRWN